MYDHLIVWPPYWKVDPVTSNPTPPPPPGDPNVDRHFKFSVFYLFVDQNQFSVWIVISKNRSIKYINMALKVSSGYNPVSKNKGEASVGCSSVLFASSQTCSWRRIHFRATPKLLKSLLLDSDGCSCMWWLEIAWNVKKIIILYFSFPLQLHNEHGL
jgi:hypothetical protein